MKRLLLNALTVLSLLLLAAVVFLWFRSHRAGDDIGYSRGLRRYYLRTGGGEVALELMRYDSGRFTPEWRWDTDPRRASQLYMIRRDTLFKRLGFYSDAATIGTPTATLGAVHTWMVPMWFAALMAAVLPATWLPVAWRSRRRRRRVEQRRCPGCGYDLRASTGRCPECGMEVAPEAAADAASPAARV